MHHHRHHPARTRRAATRRRVLLGITTALLGSLLGLIATPVNALAATTGPNTPTSTGPRVVCCGGGGSTPYPPGSIYYVQTEFFDSAGRVVAYRTGTSSWGMTHIEQKHHIDNPLAIQIAVQQGSASGPSDARVYLAVVYDTTLYDWYGVTLSTTVRVVANERVIKGDGLYQGIITAYCPDVWPSQVCPAYVGNGDVTFLRQG
ncbi:MAG: hypothetical protein ACYCU5_03385 [Actinomycetes bacterium]